jgi:hypothetical protein
MKACKTSRSVLRSNLHVTILRLRYTALIGIGAVKRRSKYRSVDVCVAQFCDENHNSLSGYPLGLAQDA